MPKFNTYVDVYNFYKFKLAPKKKLGKVLTIHQRCKYLHLTGDIEVCLVSSNILNDNIISLEELKEFCPNNVMYQFIKEFTKMNNETWRQYQTRLFESNNPLIIVSQSLQNKSWLQMEEWMNDKFIEGLSNYIANTI